MMLAKMPDTSFAPLSQHHGYTEEEQANILKAVTLLERSHGVMELPRMCEEFCQWLEAKRQLALANAIGDVLGVDVFIDPARRDDAGNKVVSLKDCTPDVTLLQEEMLSKADYVIIKLSPMLDWHRAVSELNCVQEVHIISVNNECKDLLLVLSARNMGDVEASSADGDSGEYEIDGAEGTDGEVKHAGSLRIYCVNDAQSFVCEESDMEASSVKIAPSTLEEMQYLYEPNASLMKAGCFSVLSERYGARMLSKNSHLFVSREPIAVFPGRSFRIIAVSSFNKKELKRHLSGITKANIATRNFPLSVAELRKRLKLKDGGETYIFATTLSNESHVLVITEKA